MPDCCGILGCASPGKGKKCPSKKKKRKETDREKAGGAFQIRERPSAPARPKKLSEWFVSKKKKLSLPKKKGRNYLENGVGSGGREEGVAAYRERRGRRSGIPVRLRLRGLCNCKASAMPECVCG